MDYKVENIHNHNYTISSEKKGIISKVYGYYADNPYVSIIGKHSLNELKQLIYKIEGQQKEVNYFGVFLSEMNSNGKD